MPTDLEILKELEKVLGEKLVPLERLDIIKKGTKGYVIDENNNITGLRLYNNELTDISVLKELPNLTQLDLSYNQLVDISVLKELPNLTQLDLSYNQLVDISVLKELPNLTQLDLSYNQLVDISVLKELPNLTQLNLRGDELTDISVLKELPNLTQLDLSYNQLVDISVFKKLSSLTHLYLKGNWLYNISFLRELPNLTQLDLSHNQLADISVLKYLPNLTRLDLSRNRLTDISVLRYLPNLTQLNLSDNNLSLVQLDLRGNRLTDISVLRYLPNLTQLNLSGNGLKNISFIKYLTNLTWLDLRANRLTDISVLKYLTNLTWLDLSHNNLSDIQLDLDGNKLTDISALKHLPNLKKLYLNHNDLSGVSVLKFLPNLIELDLRNNRISELPPEIVDLNVELIWESVRFSEQVSNRNEGEGIYLSTNPLESPPTEIVKKGRKAVIDYFKSLKGEKKALNEVKVLLVGDGGAGKTSLMKQLTGEKFDKNESQTHGINIRNWQVGEGDKNINVHFWDFGGQEIMHATHQFFLSKRSLYILVLDGRKDEKTEYWLKHIESFGGDSPILVILNKMDENPGFDVNRKFLREKYKGISDFCRVSCATGTGIKVFSESLSNALANVEIRETTWATAWFNVKTQLENMTDDFISYGEYKTLCANENITEKTSQDTLVDFLNDLGVILHFRDLELLDTHVLNPKWVTNAVYKIINSEKLALCNGVLRMSCLNEILKKKGDGDYHYPPEKYRYIIDLMKKFELCYEIDSRTVLIPDLLEVQEPEFDFDYGAALKFIIEYDFLPKSVMPRFIVKMHRDIKENLRWRTGVVLEDKAFHSTAVIKADERDEKIYIYVNGEQKRDYFAVILFTFREIKRSFEKLKVIEKVPMPDEPEITVSYGHLIRLEKRGIDGYIPDGSEKEYNVKDLLGTIYVEKRNEEEILEILRKLRDESDTEESLSRKANDTFILQPNFMGFGINFNKLIKKALSKKE